MKSSDIKTIVCVVCVVLGVVVQFLVYPCFVTFLIGSLLIIVPPFFLAPKTVTIPGKTKHNKKSETERRWITVEDDKIDITFRHASEHKEKVEMFSDADQSMAKGCLNYVIMGIAFILGGALAFYDEPHIGALIIDLSIVPWAYIRLKYGKKFRKVFDGVSRSSGGVENDDCVQKKSDNMSMIYIETKNLHPQMQFELARTNGKAFFTDVRILYTTHDIPGLLCSMVSASINNYIYSYAYYVLVFKGERIYNTPVMKKLESMSNHDVFTGKTSIKDDTTILVVTKTKGHLEYATEREDCGVLCEIIKELNLYIEANKTEISVLTAS